MDAALAKIIEVLLGYGLPGIIILYLVWERKVLQDQIKELMVALNLSQENRIKEARETSSALETVKDTIEILKDFMRNFRTTNGGQ